MGRTRAGWAGLAAAVAAGVVSLGGQAPATDPWAGVAERYVRLVLAVGRHDADYVDAYYGPPAWKADAEAAVTPLAALDTQAAAIAADLGSLADPPQAKDDPELWSLRRQYLTRQVAAIRARLSMLQGRTFSFDEESRALYDATAPTHTEAEFTAVLGAARCPAAGRGPPHRPLRSIQERVRHPAGSPRPRLPGSHSCLPCPDTAARDVPRTSSSPSST
ncbi:MAG: hypothetical protein R2712_20555 [Vicinamibacterales bacterium]